MGGAAIEISLEIDAGLVERGRSRKRSLLSRLFGRSPKPDDPVDLNPVLKPLREALAADFKSFVRKAMPQPWEATETFYNYLDPECKHSCLRITADPSPSGGKHAGRLSLYFSGWAGMAESSAYLASHWAESWFQREGSRIAAELLVPEGLSVTSAPEGMGESAFIPAGKYGYAFYNGPEDEYPHHFNTDECFAHGDKAETVSDFLDERCADLMRDGRCRCQLCMPDFDVGHLDGLP